MEYWLLLASSTAIIIGLAAVIYSKTKDASLLLGIAVMYYYSLLGSWFFVADCLGGKSAIQYWWIFSYIYARGELNSDYYQSIVFYSTFVVIVELYLLFRCQKVDSQVRVASYGLNHFWLFLFCGASFLCSYLTVQQQLKFAVENEFLVYHVTRGVYGFESNPLFTIHQLLNRFGVYPLFIGFALLLSSKNPRLYETRHNKIVLLACYAVALPATFSYLSFLGNKNELLVGLLGAALVYLFNAQKPRTVLLCISAFCLLGLVAAIDMFRLLRPGEYLGAISDPEFIFLSIISLFRSNEAFAAHFSLYTSLYLDIPITGGSSIINFPLGLIPSFIWPDRPNTIYEHYSQHAGIGGLGFTIHHATGWFLNFGAAGLVIGASLMGLIWSWIQIKARSSIESLGNLSYAFYALAPIMFAAAMPILIRAGPTAYKGAFYNILSAIIPIWLCSIRYSSRDSIEIVS